MRLPLLSLFRVFSLKLVRKIKKRRVYWAVTTAFFICIILMIVLLREKRVNYGWYCYDNRLCQKISLNLTVEEFRLQKDYLPSLETCRIICGNSGLWPMPKAFNLWKRRIININPNKITFRWNKHGINKDAKLFLQNISRNFKKSVSSECPRGCSGFGKQVVISSSIQFNDLALNWNTKENYSLRIDTGVAVDVRIKAATVFGVRHALETLRQFIASYSFSLKHGRSERELAIVRYVHVEDAPDFPHRGLMIDTGPFYLPKEVLKRQIEAMASCKLNRFHWKISDKLNFRLELRAMEGNPLITEGYTPEDMIEIIDYAKLHGIGVVLEVDLFDDVRSFSKTSPNPTKFREEICCLNVPCCYVSPSNKLTIPIVVRIFEELVDVIHKLAGFHIGGEDIPLECFKSELDFQNLLEHRNEIVENLIGGIKMPILIWPNVNLTLGKYMDSTTHVIQSSETNLDAYSLQTLQSKRFKVIFSPEGLWTFNYSTWSLPFWWNVYKYFLPSYNDTLGGEICYFGESNQTIDGRIWPLSLAVAERLWSKSIRYGSWVQLRYLAHRQRLVKLGIKAAVSIPKYCYLNEGECF